MRYMFFLLVIAFVAIFLHQAHKFRQQKLHESAVLSSGLKGVGSLLSAYDGPMRHLNMQLGHDLVPSEGHYRDCALECRDAIAIADSELRSLANAKINLLASCKETDTSIAALQSERIYHMAIFRYLDDVKFVMDTSLSLFEYKDGYRKFYTSSVQVKLREDDAWKAIRSFKDKWAIE